MATCVALLLPAVGFANDARTPRTPSRGDARGGGGSGSAGSAPSPTSPVAPTGGSHGGGGGHYGGGGRSGGGGGHHGGGHYGGRGGYYGGHHGHYGGWYLGPSWNWGWGGWGGWWGWSPYWYGNYGYYGYYGYPGWGYPSYPYAYGGAGGGALDFDVSPERAEVWVDGSLIGIADDFDGFPNYLWLEKGTYDIAIYLPGFRTIARQYTVYPGLVIDVEDHLESGESIHPNDLKPTSHERRDERLRRDREAQEEALRASPGDESWSPRPSDESLDARGEPGRVRLEIEPDDASVYLDGRFLGTGSDLARLRSGLLVDPGLHTLEVVRPGYVSTRQEIEVDAGSDREVEVRLEEGP